MHKDNVSFVDTVIFTTSILFKHLFFPLVVLAFCHYLLLVFVIFFLLHITHIFCYHQRLQSTALSLYFLVFKEINGFPAHCHYNIEGCRKALRRKLNSSLQMEYGKDRKMPHHRLLTLQKFGALIRHISLVFTLAKISSFVDYVSFVFLPPFPKWCSLLYCATVYSKNIKGAQAHAIVFLFFFPLSGFLYYLHLCLALLFRIFFFSINRFNSIKEQE